MADAQSVSLLLLVLVVGVAIGAVAVVVWNRGARRAQAAELVALQTRVKSQDKLAEERTLAMQQAEERLSAAFADLAHKTLAQNSDSFLRLAKESLGKHRERAKADLSERGKAIEELVKPIRDALAKTEKQIGEIEKSRHEAYGNIKGLLETMATAQDALQSETRNLVTALRRPEVRGRWGELTLRRIVELAGMVEHCDFIEQAHVATSEGAVRPDMVIRLPDRGEIVVDAKTPLDAYLHAIEASDDDARATALQRHARNVASRVRELASKAYWSQFDASPEFVILFIPGDQFLSAALSENPALLEDALREKVMLATPTSLVALLKAVAYGWRQLALADNAEEIRRLAQDMYGRLSTFTGHLAKLGKQLEGSVKTYNKAVGSMEHKVLPGARKFVDLGVQAKEPIEPLAQIESMAREVEDLSADKQTDKDEPARLAAIDVEPGETDDSSPAH